MKPRCDIYVLAMTTSNIEKEPRVENLMQKLEEACSRAEASGCGQQRDQLLHGSAYVPTRIRDIADQCLSPSRQYRSGGGAGDQTSPSLNSSALQSELKRAQDMLDQSRKDCRSLSTKYLAVSDKLKLITTLEEKIADLILENRKLVEEKTAVHCKMAEQEERHALHLRAYQDGQEKHSKLVLKLQNKVLQYKDACSDLQVKLQDEHDVFKRETSGLQETIKRLKEEVKELKEQLHTTKEADGASLQSAINEADSQEQRANQLFTSNSKLRQQLEEMGKMNQRLSEDVHQLTVGWNEAQNQLKEKDDVWHKILTEECERAVQSQKTCLKKALKDASEVKEDFRRLKFTTLRDLGLLNGEFSVVSEQLTMRVERYCGANGTMKGAMTRALQQRDQDYTKVMTELNNLKCEHEAMKTQRLMDIEGREKRIKELTSSLQTAEQAKLEQVKCVNELMSKLADIEVSQQTLTHNLTSAKNTSSTIKEDCETLKSALDEIVQLFITPGDTPLTVASRCSPTSPRRLPTSPPSTSTLSTPPIRCDCHGDSTRLKDWSISMVKHGIDASEKEMKCLENELSSMAQVLKDKQERIKLLEEEIKSHSSTTSVMKSDLGICHANLQELNKVKFRLEHQLEEMNMQKQHVERKLTQTTARLDSILDEKTKKEANNASLEEAIMGLRDQLKKMDQEKESLESKLASKGNEGHHLELQLRTSEEEVKKLRARMSELEHHKMEVEKELNSTRASVSKLELEKEDLQKELRKVKDSEYSIMATLSDLRMANTKLEADKRLLTQSLQETTSINSRLDEENARLEQVRFASEEKIQELVSTSRQMSEQIMQLDKSLQESAASKSELQMERDRLCQELAGLIESLNKAKETIAELQVQKGKLNNSITKLAREKGDLVQEKAELEKERAQLQESLHLAEDRVKTSRAAKERLEQRIEDLDKELAVAEQTAFKLQETNFALQQEKHDMKLEQERLEQAKDQAISQLQNDKALELQQVLVQARGQESDLQAAIVRLETSCDRRLAELEELHVQKVALLNSEHSRMVTQLQEAMASLKETNKDEMTRVIFQKDQHVSRMEKDKKLLQEQVNQLQELYADTCEKSHNQQTQATETISGLKVQIQTSQSTITTLEKELSLAEHQVHTLQAKLEDINCGTSEQIEALRSQLKTASDTITALEQTQDRLLIDTKQLESKREALKGQLDEVYKQLHLTSEEREALRGECQGLKQDVCSLKEELAGSKMAVSNLVENLSKTDDSRFLAEKDAKAYYKSLLSLEQAHARLTADHANLQAALTSCERRATSLQLELKESKQRGETLEGNNEQLNKKVSSLEEHLRAATKTCRQLEQESEEGRLRVKAVETERDEHKAAVIRVRDAANAEAGHQAAESLKLTSELEAAKGGCSRLRDELAELEFELETSRRGCSDLESRLTVTEGLVCRYKDEQADLMVACKELQERHSELMSVLNGTLGLKLDLPPAPKLAGVKKADDPTAGRSVDATGYLSESGIECSLDTTQGSQVGGAGVPSSYCTLVRDAILTLHKQVMDARNEKYDVASSSQLTSKRLKALEEEKALLETQLKSAQAACASLGATMEGLKKKQSESEAMCTQHTEDIQVLERKCRQLQVESDALKAKLSGERMAKEASDAKLRQLVQAKSDCDLEKGELVNQLSEARIARQRFQEQSDKLAMELSLLKSQNAAKEAELIQLQARHDDVKQRLSETEQQLVLAKESALVLDRSLSEITRKEAELVNKTHQLELQLGRLRVDRLQLEERVMHHEEESSKARREKDTLELQLQQLAQSEGHTRKKAEALEHSISDGELKKSKMASKLQQLETQLQEEHVEKIKAESSFHETRMEKKALEARLKSLEATLESATKSNVASQQLCSSLERETQHLRGEVQRLRDENGKLKTELKTVQFQLQKMDTESLPEQQKASKLSHRVLSVTQQNTELLQTVRSLKSALETKDEEYKQRLDSMIKETEKLRGAYKTTEAQWESKEKDYKASIGQFERKVQLLEDKIDRARQKRTEYMERVREHEGSIPGMRPHQDQPAVHHSPAEGGAKYVAPVRLSEEAMRLKQSTMELLQSAAPFFTPTRPSATPLTSTPIKKM